MNKLRIFDFDDTLIKTNSKIGLTKANGEKHVLTPHQYAIYDKKPGDIFDYSDFSKLVEPETIKWTTNILKNIINKYGPNGAMILTARHSEKPIKDFFDIQNIPHIPILALGDSHPLAKSQYILYIIKEFKPKVIEFFDDSEKNINATKALIKIAKEKYGTIVKVHHIKSLHEQNKKLILEQEQEDNKEFGKSITHIEDLKPIQLLNLLKLINNDEKNFIITEKMDGFYMTFGSDEQGFYAGTKNTVWRSTNNFPDLYFLAGLKSYIQKLEFIDLKTIVKQTFNVEASQIKLSGEAIPSYDHNIVIYDDNIVGDGIFVIYQITLDDYQITEKNLIQKFINQIQNHSKIKFYTNPEVVIPYKAPKKIILDLENLIKTNGNIFSKPARTEEDKILKQNLLAQIKNFGMKIKNDILKKPYKPAFGGDYEGYIIHLPDGSMVKIIDKNKFTKSKENNWHFIDRLQRLERTFKLEIKKDFNNLPNSFKQFKNGIIDVKNDFEINADKFITIPRKKNDTKEELILYARKLSNIENQINKGISFEMIANMYLNKELNKSSLRLNENRKALKNHINSSVPKEFLYPTIQNALKKLGLESIDYKIVGNMNKPVFGDIDLAINKTDLINIYNLDTSSKDAFWISLEGVLKNLNLPFIFNKGFNQFHVSVPLINSKKQIQPAYDANGEIKNPKENSMIQIDFFLGKLNWMTKVLSEAQEISKYKASFRNILLRSIVSSIKSSNPNEKFSINFHSGIDLVSYEESPQNEKKNKPKEISRIQHIGDADVLAQWLFGPKISWEDINSFELLVKHLLSPQFKFPQFRNSIIEKFKKEIDKSKLSSQDLLEENLTQEKTVGLFLGAFKPFHKGHMAGVEMASKDSDEVIIIASTRDREKNDFSMSGNIAKKYWMKYIIPILPSNVRVVFSDKPYNELIRILNEDLEPTNDNVIIYGDADDLINNFGGPTFKKLQKYIPNKISSNKFSVKQVPRIMSGSQMRKAIQNNDFNSFKDGLPTQIQSKAKEILNFFKSS